MYGRPWYVQATDVAHRLFVLSLIGGSVYIAGGLATTLYMNRASARAHREAVRQEQEALAESSVAAALGQDSESKGGSNTDVSRTTTTHQRIN